MTLKFYCAEEARISNLMRETTPGTDGYQALLRDLNSLTYVAVQTLDATDRLAYAEENATIDANINPAQITPLTPMKPEPEPAPAPAPAEPAVVETEPTQITEPVKYTADDVRSAFVHAARNGVKVNQIIAAAGYSRLSEVPTEKYNDLMARLEAAKEAGV
jgi:hypothetical protein